MIKKRNRKNNNSKMFLIILIIIITGITILITLKQFGILKSPQLSPSPTPTPTPGCCEFLCINSNPPTGGTEQIITCEETHQEGCTQDKICRTQYKCTSIEDKYDDGCKVLGWHPDKKCDTSTYPPICTRAPTPSPTSAQCIACETAAQPVVACGNPPKAVDGGTTPIKQSAECAPSVNLKDLKLNINTVSGIVEAGIIELGSGECEGEHEKQTKIPGGDLSIRDLQRACQFGNVCNIRGLKFAEVKLKKLIVDWSEEWEGRVEMKRINANIRALFSIGTLIKSFKLTLNSDRNIEITRDEFLILNQYTDSCKPWSATTLDSNIRASLNVKQDIFAETKATHVIDDQGSLHVIYTLGRIHRGELENSLTISTNVVFGTNVWKIPIGIGLTTTDAFGPGTVQPNSGETLVSLVLPPSALGTALGVTILFTGDIVGRGCVATWNGTEWVCRETWDITKYIGAEAWEGATWTCNKVYQGGVVVVECVGQLFN